MEKYFADNRTPCKYGSTCYQKNPEHHKRFKHPSSKDEQSPPKKKLKPSTSDELDLDSNTNKYNKVSSPTSTTDTDSGLPPKNYQEIHGDSNDRDSPGEEAECAIEEEESDAILASPQSVEEKIKRTFLVQMPKDFYDFWKFCIGLCESHPEDALCGVNLKLVGPFDILSGKIKMAERRKRPLLCHWRFYYDPPEFQTVLIGSVNEYHIGYFRDDPNEDPVFLASMSDSKPGTIQPMKEDLFSTVSHYVNSAACTAPKEEREKLLQRINSFAEENSYTLNETSNRLKERKKKVVSKTFHGAGIVVPVDKVNDVGYREIPETNANLRKMLRRIVDAPKENKEEPFEALHELMTNAQWATDEGDFGMGLELGLDLFTFGGEDFHSSILHLLSVAYDLLGRKPFARILEAHLKNRRKGPNMSALDDQSTTPPRPTK